MSGRTFDVSDNFQVGTAENDGWFICFGNDRNGKTWSVLTKNVQGSDLPEHTKGADGDAALVCTMLNLYYGDKRFRDIVDSAPVAPSGDAG